MSLTELNSFGEEFLSRIKKILPKGFDTKDLTVLPTGLVLMPNSTKENQGFRPLGCPKCLGKITSQDSGGYPTIDGERLLTPEEANHSVAGISPELMSNLWLCPNCRIPVSSLLPQFDMSAL